MRAARPPATPRGAGGRGRGRPTRHRRRPRPPAAPCAAHSRMWLAAPSSPNGGGHGRVHREGRIGKGEAELARASPGHSWLRCGIVTRLATVRWHRPSAVSGAGETVAAFAAHIAEADSACACEMRSPPRHSRARGLSSQASSGAARGRRMPWVSPSARLARILAMPSSAAARGCDLAGVARRGEVAGAQAGIIVARADDAVELISTQHQRATDIGNLVALADAERSRRRAVDHDAAAGLARCLPNAQRKSARRPAATSARSPPSSSTATTVSRLRHRAMVRIWSVRRGHRRAAVENVDVVFEREPLALQHPHCRAARGVGQADHRARALGQHRDVDRVLRESDRR